MSGYDLYGGTPPHQKVDTSRDAAEAIEPEVGRLQQMVIDYLREHQTATDDELEVGLGLKHQTVSARRRELVQLGRVVDTGDKRLTRGKVKAIVWALATADGTKSEDRDAVRRTRPTFQKTDLPDPASEQVKKYKAYLTRLSKWMAFEKCNDQQLINYNVLKGMLVARGELAVYLDDAWRKRVFADKDLFEDAGDGFWKVLDIRPEDAPGEPSRWEGVRPGEDVLGSVLAHAADAIGRMRTDRISLSSRFMDDDVWDPVHREMLGCMEQAKRRGYQKPLNDLQERAFHESLLDPDPAVQIVAMWLLNTRSLVDVMQRLLAAEKGEHGTYAAYELRFWGPPGAKVRQTPEGLVAEDPVPTPATTLANVRSVLLNRGILGGKKQ